MKKQKTVSNPKTSKPFYQQWWFWVILVVIIAICGGALSNTDKTDTSPNSTPTTSTNHPDNNTTSSSDSPSTPTTPSIGIATPAGKVEVTVKSIDRNYTAAYLTPSDGMEYVKVNLSIKNTSNEVQSYNALNFKIENGNGSIEAYKAMAQADDAIHTGDLAVNGTKEGSIVFEVPSGDTALKLHIYDKGFSSKILNTIDLSH